MKTMMKKAEYGVTMKDPKKTVKKSTAPVTKKKTYPILSDDGENYNGPKAGPREKTPGGGFSRNGSKVKKAMMGTGMHKMPDGSMMKNSAMKSGGAMKKCKYGCK
jgi:hypothetical protein